MAKITLREINLARKKLFLDDLYSFNKYCLGFTQMTPHTHGRICQALQQKSTNKLICVPRGTFKSSNATVGYPMWLLEHNPNLRILIDSEKFENSKNFLREIKLHYSNNELFKQVFGNRIGPTWNESEIIIKTRLRAIKEPSIVCSGIGAGKTSQHYDVIIADDLSSYENCRTRELAEKTINHFKLYTSLLEPGGTLVVIGTRYSENDIIGHVIENELRIKGQSIKELKRLYNQRA